MTALSPDDVIALVDRVATAVGEKFAEASAGQASVAETIARGLSEAVRKENLDTKSLTQLREFDGTQESWPLWSIRFQSHVRRLKLQS